MKTVFFCFISGFLLILLLFFTRPYYLPDSLLISLVQKKIAEQTGYQLRIEDSRIRLVNSLLLRRISLCDSGETVKITADEIRVKYRLLPLINRRLVIKHFSLKNPQIEIQRSFLRPKELQAVALDTSNLPPSTYMDLEEVISFDLPVTVEIDSGYVINGELQFVLKDSLKEAKVVLRGLNLFGELIRVKSADNFNGKMRINQDDTLSIHYQDDLSVFKLNSLLISDFRSSFNSKESTLVLSLNAKPELTYRQDSELRFMTLPEIEISTSGTLRGMEEFRLDALKVTFGQMANLNASGVVEDLFNERNFTVEIQDGNLQLRPFITLFDSLSHYLNLPPLLLQQVITGELFISNSRISGKFSDENSLFKGALHYGLRNGSLRDISRNLYLDGLSLNSTIEGQYTDKDNFNGSFNLDLNVNQVRTYIPPDSKIEISPLSLAITSGIESGWRNPHLQILWDGKSPHIGDQKGRFSAHARALDISVPLRSPDLTFEGSGAIEDLPLAAFQPDLLSGDLSFAYDFIEKDLKDIRLQIEIACPDLRVQLEDTSLSIPQLIARLDAQGSISPKLDEISFQRVHAELFPYLELKFTGGINDTKKWKIQDIILTVDLERVLHLTKPLFPEAVADLSVHGSASLVGACQVILDTDSPKIQPGFRIITELLSIASQKHGFHLDSVLARSEISGDEHIITVKGEAEIGRFTAAVLRDDPYRGIKIGWSSGLRGYQEITRSSLWITADDLEMRVNVEGAMGGMSKHYPEEVTLDFTFDSPESVFPIRGIELKGGIKGQGSIQLSADTTYSLSGVLSGENIYLDYKDRLILSGLNFDFPFATEFSLDSTFSHLKIRHDARQLLAVDQMVFGNIEHLIPMGSTLGKVTCQQIRFSEHKLDNLHGLIYFRQGNFISPQFSLKFSEGEIEGAISVGIPTLHPDSIKYKVDLAALGINTALLTDKKTSKGEGSRISTFARFKGQGIDMEKSFVLEGGVDITHIGRQVADDLLRFLDPEQSDPSIQTYRRYLKKGWGVKVFSFNVKDDFVYVSIIPSRPPISKLDMFLFSRLVGLGKSVTFGRLPLKYFLSNSTKYNQTPLAQEPKSP